MSRALLMARRGHGETVEAEPVVASVHDGILTLDLDNGDCLVLDVEELIALAVADEGPQAFVGEAA